MLRSTCPTCHPALDPTLNISFHLLIFVHCLLRSSLPSLNNSRHSVTQHSHQKQLHRLCSAFEPASHRCPTFLRAQWLKPVGSTILHMLRTGKETNIGQSLLVPLAVSVKYVCSSTALTRVRPGLFDSRVLEMAGSADIHSLCRSFSRPAHSLTSSPSTM